MKDELRKRVNQSEDYTQFSIEWFSDLVDDLATALEEAEQENARLREAIMALRKEDCGAWLKDCSGGIFLCKDGREARQRMMRLLDAAYKCAEEKQNENK